ncbi:hypothetical protein Cassandra_0296 [Pseudomonas phage Cassandra]|nr:hypothetical protein Cassandra_0296 [Pseudomonas phage Cassandra]
MIEILIFSSASDYISIRHDMARLYNLNGISELIFVSKPYKYIILTNLKNHIGIFCISNIISERVMGDITSNECWAYPWPPETGIDVYIDFLYKNDELSTKHTI